MMMLHVVMPKALDFERIAAEALADRGPGHVLMDLTGMGPTRFHAPTSVLAVTRSDRLHGKLFARPEVWALARQVMAAAGPEDVIFCTGEDVGLPVATMAGRMPEGARPRVAVFAHNLNRPRAKMALRVFRCVGAVTHWMTNAPLQAGFLWHGLGIPEADIHLIPEQTDTRFFRPGAKGRAPGSRPLLVAVGLEQRDYRTLAAAVETLEVEVKISGYSKDARAMKDAFPDTLPENMKRAFYPWVELRQLYWDADLVIVPLFNNPYCAGLTAVLEGLACQKPVVVSRTDGLAPYWKHEETDANGAARPEICLAVPPENPGALRTGVEHLLQSQTTAAALAVQGHAWVMNGHTPHHWLTAMSGVLMEGTGVR